MSTKQMRALFLKVRRVATQLAERCDFVTASRIKEAAASCGENFAAACVKYRDQVERAQIVTAFTYGASLNGLTFQCNGDEDVTLEGKLSMVTINLEHPEHK